MFDGSYWCFCISFLRILEGNAVRASNTMCACVYLNLEKICLRIWVGLMQICGEIIIEILKAFLFAFV